MSGTVVFEDAKLQAVELIAETVTLNNFSVSTATTFQQTTNASNVTTNTLRFTNPTTAFVTTGNVEVGGELTVGSNVEIGTANLFVDTTTGNVGIGTASPSAPLHILGGGGSSDNSATDLSTSVARAKLRFQNRSGSSLSQYHGTSNSGDTWYQQIANWAGTGSYDMVFNPFGGNVGIGTASPTYKLNISTDTNYDGISLRDSTRELLKIAKGNNGSYINMFESGTSKVNISTNGDSYINGGNVGIGVANPNCPLHIASDNHLSFEINSSSITNDTYGYSEMRMLGPGQSNAGLSIFCNGANRTADGGVSTTTIRNNNGPIVFGHSSYMNRLRNPRDEDYIVGTWKTTLDASASTTVKMNVGSCVTTPAATGTGMSGNIGRFTAPVTGYYYTYCHTIQATRSTSNLLIVYDAGGTNFATNNVISTYDEIIDLRNVANEEEVHTFGATLHMEVGDYIGYRVHSSGYTDSASYHIQCSAFLLNRI